MYLTVSHNSNIYVKMQMPAKTQARVNPYTLKLFNLLGTVNNHCHL